jgi:hypothetical protein
MIELLGVFAGEQHHRFRGSMSSIFLMKQNVLCGEDEDSIRELLYTCRQSH